MTGPGPGRPEDLSEVATTDALLDELGSTGRLVEPGQLDHADSALRGLLTSWRAELDDRAATVMTAGPIVSPPRPARWVRAHRRTAAATALVVALATSTGVAAAASGPTGPLGGLHNLIFGDSPAAHHLDGLAAAAQRRLDAAGRQINAAGQAGSITAAAHDRIATDLDSADRLLNRDSLAPMWLLDRLNHLRTALAGIPLSVPTPPVVDNRGHGQSGSDNSGTDDRGGRGGDDNSGSGSQDGNSQGSDDGSGSGSGGDGSSGDDGNSGSGSQDGSSQGGGSQDGSSQDGGSQDGGSQDGGSQVGGSPGSDDGSGSDGGGGGDQGGSGDSNSGGGDSGSSIGGGDSGGD